MKPLLTLYVDLRIYNVEVCVCVCVLVTCELLFEAACWFPSDTLQLVHAWGSGDVAETIAI